MSDTVNIVAILTPKPGCVDQVSLNILHICINPENTELCSTDSCWIQAIASLEALLKGVEEHEPDAFRYELFQQVNCETGAEELVFIEE